MAEETPTEVEREALEALYDAARKELALGHSIDPLDPLDKRKTLNHFYHLVCKKKLPVDRVIAELQRVQAEHKHEGHYVMTYKVEKASVNVFVGLGIVVTVFVLYLAVATHHVKPPLGPRDWLPGERQACIRYRGQDAYAYLPSSPLSQIQNELRDKFFQLDRGNEDPQFTPLIIKDSDREWSKCPKA
jgi:hypothetical protein